VIKVYTTAYLNAMAYAQVYALGALLPPIPLSGCKIGLFNNHPTLTQNTVLADLVETIFSAYAQATITWDAAPIIDAEGLYALRGVTAAPFQSTGPITPDNVAGLFVVNGGGTTLYYAEFFDQIIQITRPAQIIQATLFCRPNGDGGVDSVIGP